MSSGSCPLTMSPLTISTTGVSAPPRKCLQWVVAPQGVVFTGVRALTSVVLAKGTELMPGVGRIVRGAVHCPPCAATAACSWRAHSCWRVPPASQPPFSAVPMVAADRWRRIARASVRRARPVFAMSASKFRVGSVLRVRRWSGPCPMPMLTGARCVSSRLWRLTSWGVGSAHFFFVKDAVQSRMRVLSLPCGPRAEAPTKGRFFQILCGCKRSSD